MTDAWGVGARAPPATVTAGDECQTAKCPAPCNLHFCICCMRTGVKFDLLDSTIHRHIETCHANLTAGSFAGVNKAQQLSVTRAFLAVEAMRRDRTLRDAFGSDAAVEATLAEASDLELEALRTMGLRVCCVTNILDVSCPVIEPELVGFESAYPRIAAALEAELSGQPHVRMCTGDAAPTVSAVCVRYVDMDRAAMKKRIEDACNVTSSERASLTAHFMRLRNYMKDLMASLDRGTGVRVPIKSETFFLSNLAYAHLGAMYDVAACDHHAADGARQFLDGLVAIFDRSQSSGFANHRKPGVLHPKWVARLQAIDARKAAEDGGREN